MPDHEYVYETGASRTRIGVLPVFLWFGEDRVRPIAAPMNEEVSCLVMTDATLPKPYRILLLDTAGRVLRTKVLSVHEETDAIERTRALMDGRAVELWDGDRLVLRLDPSDTPSA